jgi:lipopolysaccharide transport system permease protein
MLRSFVWRDLASRYEGSMLGWLWPLVYPLLLLGVYHLVFAEFLQVKFGGMNSALDPGWVTTFYMLSGILPWLAFADTLARSTNVIVENSNLIKKIAFPSELLPTFVATTHLIQFVISIALLVVVYLVVCLLGLAGVSSSEGASLAANLIWLPIPIVLQYIFLLGASMVLATVNVFVRDLMQVMPVTLLLWMLVSPIFYNVETVRGVVDQNPEKAWMLSLMQFNPVFHLLEMYRACFPSAMNHAFPWASCGIFAALAVALFLGGYWLFSAAKNSFADEV